jgi:uncharacterized metal-binding protein YceD (DUF177 family)
VSAPERAAPPAAELSRRFPVSRVGTGASFTVEAEPWERAALAQRMGLIALHALSCRFDLQRGEGGRIPAQGWLRARLRQTCVVSLEPFDGEVEEDFRVCFVPAGTESDDLDLEAEDELPYEDGVLDLGEAASEQLALALDPFPRRPDAEPAAAAAPQPTGAFAALAKLLPPQ